MCGVCKCRSTQAAKQLRAKLTTTCSAEKALVAAATRQMLQAHMTASVRVFRLHGWLDANAHAVAAETDNVESSIIIAWRLEVDQTKHALMSVDLRETRRS